MLKLLFIAALVYFSYRLIKPKSLEGDKRDELSDRDDDGYTDYEEIE